MRKVVPKEVSEYMRKIGAKGGRNGKGSKKRRPKSHYSKAGKSK